MIRLFAENPGQANPNLALRWCIDRETLDELKKKGIKNPRLLLVMAQHPNQWMVTEIERKLVPLDQAMEWLEFNRPGHHTIYATVVWDDDNIYIFDAQELLKRRTTEEGEFRWGMFDCDGKFSRIRRDTVYEHSLDEGSLDVVITEKFFAKEPPAWLNWWVNLWFDALNVPRPANQCFFRRRKWFVAFPIQPIPVFIWVLLKSLARLVMALALVSCGMRGISFKPVIHPFDLILDNVWRDMGPSIFLKDKHGKWHFGFIGRGLQTIWRALMPPPSAEELERRWQAMGEQISKKAAKQAHKEREKQEGKRRKLETFYEELQDVACFGVPLKPKLELLPERRRTIYLRYMDLKAKVCKPYAR